MDAKANQRVCTISIQRHAHRDQTRHGQAPGKDPDRGRHEQTLRLRPRLAKQMCDGKALKGKQTPALRGKRFTDRDLDRGGQRADKVQRCKAYPGKFSFPAPTVTVWGNTKLQKQLHYIPIGSFTINCRKEPPNSPGGKP